ncbi:armadillo-type protein [Abortiporus biennis]|nr:armadillo-type protein [Abortiporus biennis]
MVATRTGGQPSPRKLKFHEKLVGKGLSIDTLQKKLKALHTELASLDQELVDTNSLSSVRKELINPSILLHKDRGVKAYAACCLADLLRLYAPDAPYTQPELRDIFSFFFRQLTTGLKGADSPYYNEYFHLLESLSTVKSVVLVCDLPNADDLMSEIFRGCFGLVRQELAKKIELFIADILIALIDECQNLPHDVLHSILSQFMDKNPRMNQPAYRLAVQVCNATADKLQRHVCQYFTELIVNNAREEDYEEVRKAHELIKQLNRACPSLLHNVVPQLEEELRVEDHPIRVMATQVLGEMFADKGGADFVRKYPTTWAFWLQRKNDKTPAVRLAFVEATKGVLANLPDARDQIEDALHAKLLDPEEKVRAAVCKLYSELDYEVALHHVSGKQLRSVANRAIDRKHSVQVEAINAVSRLYNLAYSEIENGDPAALQHFGWIPQAILHSAPTTSEVKALVLQALTEFIIPFPSSTPSTAPSGSKAPEVDEVAWTDRLLFIMKSLDELAISILLGLSGIKSARPSVYERYLQACIANNGGVIDQEEEKIVHELSTAIKKVASLFPDATKATEDLQNFAKMNENRLYKLLKTCLDPQTDLKNLIKASSEFLRRVEQQASNILPTMTSFLRRATLRIVNQSSIPTLIRRVQRGIEGPAYELTAHNAKVWLNHISKYYPALYQPHIGELSKAITEPKNVLLVEVSLQALAAVGKWDEKLVPSDKRTIERVRRYVMEENLRHAKFAARILAFTKNREELCNEVVEAISDQLPEVDDDLLVAHVAVLAQFSLLAPDAFEEKSDVIMAFLLKKILMGPTPSDPDRMEVENDWIEDSDLHPRLRAKLLALKTCRNRCLVNASTENALDIVKPVLKMFTTLVTYGGAFKPDTEESFGAKARMRSQAVNSLLQLSQVPAFAQVLNPNFVPIAITIQDTCYQVRMSFMTKLLSLLTSQKLPSHYNIVPFLTVHDPEPDMQTKAKAYIAFAIRQMPKPLRLACFEMNFIRLLHVLAHHPDFGTDKEHLPDVAKYISFFLEQVASADNISLLFHLAMKTKTVRDAESHAYSENLYAASELAQHLIRTRAKAHGWSIESYPGKVKLPGDILRPLPNAEAANEVVKTVYLPEDAFSFLEEKKQHKAAERKVPAKRKASATKHNGTK